MANYTNASPNATFPSPRDFILSIPLYKEFPITKYKIIEDNPVYDLEYFRGTIDCYCMQCKAHSIFQCHEKIEPDRDLPPSLYHNYIFTLLLTCSRKKDHEILFLFFANDGKLQKIGQYPSLADLATPDIYKYRNILGDERYKEFTRGVGLASHGVGIGAFVYFRRIFEFLIEKAHLVAKSIINWDEDKYIKSRMDEKITLLQAHLPEVLVKTKSLYGILSKGIHSLTEDECLDSFKVVKLGIELILDEELARKTREDKIRVASKDIGTLGNLLKRDEK